jgi:hypothetical protein
MIIIKNNKYHNGNARGECGDKIFSLFLPLLPILTPCQTANISPGSLLFRCVGECEERSTRKHKRRHILCCFMRRRRKGKKGKEKCFYSFALFYDKYHCFVPENVSSHTPKNIPLCHCHLNFFIISFCVLPLSRPPPARTVCDPKIVYEFLTRNGQGWKKQECQVEVC